MSLTRFKLVFLTPRDHTGSILDRLFRILPKELGSIGEYEQCAFITRGTGQFKPKKSANPTIGASGQLEYVDEDRVGIVVKDLGGREKVKKAIKVLKNVHQEVGFDVYKLDDL